MPARIHARTLVLVVTSVVVAVMATLLGTIPAQAQPRPGVPMAPSTSGYAIGDSVMLGARSQLRKRGFVVNAAVSRQSYSGPAMVRKRALSLPRALVVHLGTNGTFPLDTCRRIVTNAGITRKVYLVTVAVPRSWERSNNRVIRRCAASFPAGRVTVVDWKGLVSRHRAWLTSDGFHLRPDGAVGYARLIARTVAGG